MKQGAGSIYGSCLVIVTGLLLLWHFLGYTPLLYASLSIGIIASLSKRAARLIHRGWHGIADLLASVVGPLLLSLIFFLLLFPLGLLSRLVRKEDLLKLRSGDERSLWRSRTHRYGAEDLKVMW